MSIEDKNIPQQEKGNQVDVIHHQNCNNKEAAEQLFASAQKRLFDVSRWKEIADGFSAGFQLTDSNGAEINRPAQKGDCFKIDLPAPGSKSGGDEDWVKIEAIQVENDAAADIQIASIRVRPCANPKNPQTDTAHFFQEDATSTFEIKRKGNTVTAEVHGRNEIPNVHADSILDTIRHAVVAVGAIFGFSNKQWKNLVEGLIDPKKQG